MVLSQNVSKLESNDKDKINGVQGKFVHLTSF